VAGPEPKSLASGKLRLDFPADHVARLTIDHPAKRNALDHELLDAFAAELPQIEARCLLITATGSVFSAGYDIGNLQDADAIAEAESLVAHPFHAAIGALDAFPFPAVAALNGHAIGGGLELALSCDLRLAVAEARLGMPPARLGLVYSHTGLRKFIDVIGVARTRELFYTARSVTAQRAYEWGLVNELADAGELERRAVDYAARIAANAPLSLRGNKRVIGALLAAEGALDERVSRELVELREACFRTQDFAEGVRAFGEKRAPRWRGA
jgi:enoyl-CoA hydratase/carnithine racemase